MQYFGFFLLALSLGGIGYVVYQALHIKKLTASKLHKTGELVSNPSLAGPKGEASAEGKIIVQQPIIAPCSGQPAIYYEIKVERKWEKYENTEDGQKKRTGTDTVSEIKQAGPFWIDDGSGPIAVDARQDVKADTKQSFKQEQKGVVGSIVFGQFTAQVPHAGDKTTTAVVVTESILAPEGTLFAMGKLQAGTLMKTDGMMGHLMLSTKGKEGHVAHVKKQAMIGGIVTVLMLGSGTAIAVTADPPAPSVCQSMVNAMKKGDVCDDRVTDDTGEKESWKVTKAGGYRIEVNGTGKSSSMRLWPHVSIDKAGKEVADESSDTTTATIEQCFDKGTYDIQIRDTTKGHVGGTIKGGAGFKLAITEAKGLTCKGGGDDDTDSEGKTTAKKGGDDSDDSDKKAKADDSDTKPAGKADKKKKKKTDDE